MRATAALVAVLARMDDGVFSLADLFDRLDNFADGAVEVVNGLVRPESAVARPARAISF